jgi:hypothetical protein
VDRHRTGLPKPVTTTILRITSLMLHIGKDDPAGSPLTLHCETCDQRLRDVCAYVAGTRRHLKQLDQALFDLAVSEYRPRRASDVASERRTFMPIKRHNEEERAARIDRLVEEHRAHAKVESAAKGHRSQRLRESRVARSRKHRVDAMSKRSH